MSSKLSPYGTSAAPFVAAGSVLVAGAALYLYYLRSSGAAAAPKKAPMAIPSAVAEAPPRGFTAAELAAFTGAGGGAVYVSVKGVVFSVAPQLYGPGAPYHCFAGTECSRCLGKGIVGESEEMNADWRTMRGGHLETLDSWYDRLNSKYRVVGWFVPDDQYEARAAALKP